MLKSIRLKNFKASQALPTLKQTVIVNSKGSVTSGPYVVKHLLLSCVMYSLVQAAPVFASEPVVAFAANGGFLELTLKRDGKAIDAIVELRDEKGTPILGETENGEATIPLPAGASYTIELKTGERTADPIRLYRTPTGVEPSRVLLSYGLRPCCRTKVQREPIIAGAPDPAPEPEEPRWWDWRLVLAGIVGIWLAITLPFLFAKLMRRGAPGNSKE